ncbi:hypothetical protein D3C84_1022790 [compost metagenome]
MSNFTPRRLTLCAPSFVESNTPLPGTSEVTSLPEASFRMYWVLLVNSSVYGCPWVKLLLYT